MSTPTALPVWTLLLGAGQILPFIALALTVATHASLWPLAALAVGLVYAARMALAIRFKQDKVSVVVHPLALFALLGLQWTALCNAWRGRPAVWRSRDYLARVPKQANRSQQKM